MVVATATTAVTSKEAQPQAFPIKLSNDLLRRISQASTVSLVLSPSGLPSELIIDEERLELVCTEEHQQLDLLDLKKGGLFVKTGIKHKLTVKSELADSQRKVIRDEHERAIKEKSTRTIKSLAAPTQKRKLSSTSTIAKKGLSKIIDPPNLANLTNPTNTNLINSSTTAVTKDTNVAIEMNLQNRLKTTTTEVQGLLDSCAWIDPISTCYSLRKECARMIRPRAWPHYSPRERQLVADNLLKLQMTGDYDLPRAPSAHTNESANSPRASNKPVVKGVKGRIQKVISRIRK